MPSRCGIEDEALHDTRRCFQISWSQLTSNLRSPSSQQPSQLPRLLTSRCILATFAASAAPVGRHLTLMSVRLPLPSQFRPPMLTAFKHTLCCRGSCARLAAK